MRRPFDVLSDVIAVIRSRISGACLVQVERDRNGVRILENDAVKAVDRDLS